MTTPFIKLETGTLVNVNHIIAVDELDDGNALIVMDNEMFSYEDSRGKDTIESLINDCFGIRVSNDGINWGASDFNLETR